MRCFCVLALLLAAGCGNPVTESLPPESVPLKIAEWRTLPSDAKFTIETMERLKAGEPTLNNSRGWEAFVKSTLNPARKRELGGRAK